MSSDDKPVAENKPAAPAKLTSSFELQTKIRLIIQDLLAATVRRVAHFGDKIEKFEEYFITFRQKFDQSERQRSRHREQMEKLSAAQIAIRKQLNLNDIRYNQDKDRNDIILNQHKTSLEQLQKQSKSLFRQNENINSELSKTKSKFLEYSGIISAMKQQVSFKITKYLEETADAHTKMQLYMQNVKNQYFNITLAIDKQKSKYQQIVLQQEDNFSYKQQTQNAIAELHNINAMRTSELAQINTKVDNVQFLLLSKLKQADTKLDNKMSELQKNTTKLQNTIKKVQNFGSLFEGIKINIQDNKAQVSKKIQQTLKTANQFAEQLLNKATKDIFKTEKAIQKKIQIVQQKIDKTQDFFLQKIQFMKMQVQSQMATKTNKLLQQKSKNQKTVSADALQQINGKITKVQLQLTKNIAKVQSNLKEGLQSSKNTIQTLKTNMQVQISTVVRNSTRQNSNSLAPMVSKQMINSMMSKESISQVTMKLGKLQQDLNKRINNVDKDLNNLSQKVEEGKKKSELVMIELEQKLSSKTQKIMFLVTKMRGDSIIRNEFNDKQIKQLKKWQIEVKEKQQLTWRLLPGLGQCINLILALIFDAQFQHSRIIQDNLPALAKDIERFNTCNQGVIYEFKQKKKPGFICYRHMQIKKTDLVRATFNGYIQLWQQLYEAQIKNKGQIYPKTFYKRLVEKSLKGSLGQDYYQGQGEASGSHQNQLNRSSGMLTEQQRHSVELGSKDSNSSFQIRKKKRSVLIRQRQDVSSEYNIKE